MRTQAIALLVLLLAGCSSAPVAKPSAGAAPALASLDHLPAVMGAAQELRPDAAFGAVLPAFAQRDVGHLAGEPTLAISRTGAVLYPAISFDTPGGALPQTHLYLTKSNGTSWTDVTPCLVRPEVPTGPAAGSACAGKISPYGVDPMVYGDPTTGRLFNIDLQEEASYLSYTDDDGATWNAVPLAGGNYQKGHDHQTLWAGPPVGEVRPSGYPNLLYYCVNTGDISCARSADGGATWTATAQPHDSCQAGLHGHGVSSPTGAIFFPQTNYCDAPILHISADAGATWTETVVNHTVGVNKVDFSDGSVAVDQAGAVYYFWLDANALPRLAVSHDQGRSFGPAYNVTVPGLRTAGFPTLVAGSQGRIAFLYYATTYRSSQDPDKHAQEFRDDYTKANPDWNAYIGMSLDADGDHPTFATALANDPKDPIAKGACLDRCYGVYDFLDIDIDPVTGHVRAALVDVCHDACAKPGGKPPTVYPDGFGAIAAQTAGPSLLDQPIAKRT